MFQNDSGGQRARQWAQGIHRTKNFCQKSFQNLFSIHFRVWLLQTAQILGTSDWRQQSEQCACYRSVLCEAAKHRNDCKISFENFSGRNSLSNGYSEPTGGSPDHQSHFETSPPNRYAPPYDLALYKSPYEGNVLRRGRATFTN